MRNASECCQISKNGYHGHRNNQYQHRVERLAISEIPQDKATRVVNTTNSGCFKKPTFPSNPNPLALART